MTANFPPEPVYPLAIDTNRTLYLVYNTTESVLAVDNEPWSDEIEIVPVGNNDPELWADNGFGTIDGELFYYDSVEKNSSGKVFKLKKCLRNLGGEQTHYNSRVGGSVLCPTTTGTIVRGLVVAEHHNQIAKAIHQVEEFIGRNFDPDVATLDFRIRCLQEVPICDDDVCTTINSFVVNRLETTGAVGCVGVTIEYSVDIQGAFTGYRLDFGDGTFTTTEIEGSHTYSPGAVIDPIVVIDDPNCQVLQSPMERINIEELPQTVPEQRFEIPIPILPEIPDIDIPDIGLPEARVVVPPIVFPFLSLTPLAISVIIPGIEGINIPSLIEFGPVNIPSLIEFGPINIPSLIEFGPINIPSVIEFGDVNIPSQIGFGDVNIPSVIEFGDVNIPSVIEFGDVAIPSQIEIVGPEPSLPSQIEIVGPDPPLPSQIEIVGDIELPSQIEIIGPDPPLPSQIEIVGPDPALPSQIEIVGPDPALPSQIEIVGLAIPSVIEVSPGVPSVIEIIGPDPAIPSQIEIVGPDPALPSQIELVDPNNIAGGLPSQIEIVGTVDLPSEIAVTGMVELPSEIALTGVPSALLLSPSPELTDLLQNLDGTVSVDWGTPPAVTGSIDVVVTVTCSSATAVGGTPFWDSSGFFIEDDDNLGFETDDNINVNVEDIGIPTEIQVVAPNFPRMIRLEHDLPEKIDINEPYIPERIFIEGPAQPLPDRIEIVADFNIPDSIELTATNVPQTIELVGRSIPEVIRLDVPSNFPESIKLDASDIPETIKVTGVPESITLIHDIPKEVFLKAPEGLEIPIAWKGAPMDVNVKVDLDIQKLTGEDRQDVQCVAIVPCPQK
jgi:hypothetical protein